jgi:prepilin-type N-terminal cleavage/methylation domain-containing protein
MSSRNVSKLHSQRGFTLAEILVTTAIFAIIMIAALAVYDRSNRVFKESTEAADLQQSTRVGFDKLVSDLRMAGFDYNRGGIPNGTGQYPQPDEQIEYAGPAAVVFRSNFDYNTNASNANGLATGYSAMNTGGGPIFPYVTTDNNEIVAYVLRSADSTKNTDKLAFWADVAIPRRAYPNVAGQTSGGTTESTVTLGPATCSGCGIDQSNANPPYTLYRVTVDDIRNGRMGTPVAENLRSLHFIYFTDAAGTALVKEPGTTNNIPNARNADGSTVSATYTVGGTTYYTGAIGGAGQYDPASIGTTANFADRNQRALVQSVRVDLVGMNANPALGAYTNSTETIAAIKSYRQYSLSSLVVPRNLGKTGFPEPSYNPPGPPTITGLCVGHCGAPVIYWDPPSVGGPVVKYRISWDTNTNGAFNTGVDVNDVTAISAVLPDDGAFDVSKTYYYKMVAANDNGASASSNQLSGIPQNRTRPTAPTALSVTSNQPNQIPISWTAPTTNDPGKSTLSCSGTGGSTNGTQIPVQEFVQYRIYRGLTDDFDPATGVIVLNTTSASQPPLATPGSPVSWTDSATTSAFPPGNCTNYYYRIQAIDRCSRQNNWNASNSPADSMSDIYPPYTPNVHNAILGASTESAAPAPPNAVKVLTSGSPPQSSCPDQINGANPNCRVTLQWNAVTTDTASPSANAIGVDTYRVTRRRKHQNNLPANGYVDDTTFNSGQAYKDISGFSQVVGGVLTWADTNGEVADSNPPWIGSLWSYEYVIQAKGCTLSGYSAPPVDFPVSCTINPNIVSAGASNPLANGDTPATAWIMNAGDTITVTPVPPTVLTKVQFVVTTWPGGAAVDNLIVNSSPFVYAWSDRVDLQIYQITITVTDSAGCQEVHIKYVQDQSAAPCSFANVTPPAPSAATSGSTTTESITFAVLNNGTDPMNFNVLSPAFRSDVIVTWTDPRTPPSGTYNTSLSTLVYQIGAFNTSDNFSTTAPNNPPTPPPVTATTRPVPTNLPNLAASATMNLTVRFTHKKTENAFPATPSAITKLCISYRIPSEPTTTKFCNLVGQSATTNNPSACD